MKTSLWTRLRIALKKFAFILGLSALLVVLLDRFVISLEWVLDPESLSGAQKDTANWKFCQAGMFQSLDDPLRHFGLTPSMDISIDSCRYLHNKEGLRDGEVTAEKAPEEFRILMIGDSYTYGWGVDQGDTISAQTQALLHQEEGGSRVRILNCGVPAYDTAAEFGFLDSVGSKMAPDAIVLVFQVNDVTEVDHFYFDEYKGFYACSLPLSYGIKRSLDDSPIYHLVRKAHIAIKSGSGFEWFGPEEWPRTESYLIKFMEKCQALGLPLVIVNLPHFQIGSSDKFLPQYREQNPGFCIQNDWVRETSESKGVPTIEILPLLQERVSVHKKPVEALYVRLAELDEPPEDENGNPRYKQIPDHHLNREGCGIVAAQISQFIIEKGWVPGL